MCRNIKTLFNFEPPATEDEISIGAAVRAQTLRLHHAVAGQTPRHSIARWRKSREAARRLLTSLHTHAPSETAKPRREGRERSRQGSAEPRLAGFT